MRVSPKAVAAWHLFLADCCNLVSKDEAEIRHYRAAIAAQKLAGTPSKQAIQTRLGLAYLLLHRIGAEFSEGRESLDAIEIELKEQKAQITANMGRLCMLQGFAAERVGDFALALHLYKRSHAVFVASYILFSADHIKVLDHLSRLYRRLGNQGRANYYFGKAMVLRRQFYGARHHYPYR